MNVKLHVEHLVLEGIDIAPAAPSHVRVAVEAELGRLIAERRVGQLAAGGAVPFLRGEDIQIPGNRDPRHLGRCIARSVYGEIEK